MPIVGDSDSAKVGVNVGLLADGTDGGWAVGDGDRSAVEVEVASGVGDDDVDCAAELGADDVPPAGGAGLLPVSSCSEGLSDGGADGNGEFSIASEVLWPPTAERSLLPAAGSFVFACWTPIVTVTAATISRRHANRRHRFLVVHVRPFDVVVPSPSLFQAVTSIPSRYSIGMVLGVSFSSNPSRSTPSRYSISTARRGSFEYWSTESSDTVSSYAAG